MFFVEASGSPYEIGYQTGEATRFAVASTVDLFAKSFRHRNTERFQRARDRNMSYTEKRCPELVEEVAGLADAVGLPFELMYLTNFYASMRAETHGCSNFIFTDTPRGPILAKTNDLPAHEGKHTGIRLLRPTGGPAVICGSWLGTVWRGFGVSEAGLAIGGSSCSAAVPAPIEFMNPHAMGTYLFSRAETVEDAIKLLAEVAASDWGANWALADKSGNAAIVEKAGKLQGVRRVDGSRIWCTNHALTAELAPHVDKPADALAESAARYDTISKLTRLAPLTDELARDVVAYDRQPGALCRYGGTDPLRNETELAALMFPALGEMEFCFSHADRDPWYRVGLAEGAPPTRLADL